jgi:hypothetical protein
MGVLHRRGIIAAAAVVAFNVLMFVLAALGPIPMEAPFLVAWMSGDAVLSLAALAFTEPRSWNQPGLQIHSRTLAQRGVPFLDSRLPVRRRLSVPLT